MTNPNEPSGPTKVKGAQSLRQAAEGEEKLIDQQAGPAEPAPETSTPPHGDPLAEAGQGEGTGEGKP